MQPVFTTEHLWVYSLTMRVAKGQFPFFDVYLGVWFDADYPIVNVQASVKKTAYQATDEDGNGESVPYWSLEWIEVTGANENNPFCNFANEADLRIELADALERHLDAPLFYDPWDGDKDEFLSVWKPDIYEEYQKRYDEDLDEMVKLVDRLNREHGIGD